MSITNDRPVVTTGGCEVAQPNVCVDCGGLYFTNHPICAGAPARRDR